MSNILKFKMANGSVQGHLIQLNENMQLTKTIYIMSMVNGSVQG
jgi:hypothetical protein